MTRRQKRLGVLTAAIAPLAIAAAMSLPPLTGSFAYGQAVESAAAAAPVVDAALKTAVEDFWHYGKIARYDLAAAAGRTVLESTAGPGEVLGLFESAAAQRNDNLDQWILRWQSVPEMKPVAEPISAVLSQGWEARRADPAAIEQHIKNLAGGDRSYALAVQRLRESGELAVPQMIAHLQNPASAAYHGAILRALGDIGPSVLNPLTVATEMGDSQTLVQLVGVLGRMGYDVPPAYLAKLATSAGTSESVRTAAAAGLLHSNRDVATVNAADEFYELAERLYYDKSAIAANPGVAKAYVWYWDDSKGLTKKDVPPQILNEILAQRAAAEALRLDATDKDALSLWLAANYKREAEMPADAVDPTRGLDPAAADFYGAQAGTQYLFSVLERAERDANSAVALGATSSLSKILGRSALAEQDITALTEAMSYPDRRVRYEAALAMANALPQAPFDGSDRAVPILAEAIGQTGMPTVLLLQPDTDALNSLTAMMKAAGFAVAGGTTAEAALAESASLASVDAVIISEMLPASEIDALLSLAEKSPRLQKSAKLIVGKSSASPYAIRAANDPYVSVGSAGDTDTLMKALDAGRVKAGALPLTPELATLYALRSADALEMLGVNQSIVLDPTIALPSVLAALGDPRPEVVMAAGEAAAVLNGNEVQPALLNRLKLPNTSDAVTISLLNSLATNAQRFGNGLSDDQVVALRELVNSKRTVDVRTAAAAARGGLDLPVDEARALILTAEKP